jgi:hypothetical protein
MSAHLRGPVPPTRVGELLLPTLLTLAGRGRMSAENFLTLLACPPKRRPPSSTQVTAHLAQDHHHLPGPGTRVTASLRANPRLPAEVSPPPSGTQAVTS